MWLLLKYAKFLTVTLLVNSVGKSMSQMQTSSDIRRRNDHDELLVIGKASSTLGICLYRSERTNIAHCRSQKLPTIHPKQPQQR